MELIQQLNTRKSELIANQEKVLRNSLETKVKLTDAQESDYAAATAEIESIDKTVARMNALEKGKREVAAPTSDVFVPQPAKNTSAKKTFSAEYHKAFWSSIKDRNFTNAALNEGTTTEGGFTVPVVVLDQIVPLAPLESAMRKLALVLVTESDIKIPQQASRTVAAQKAESGDTFYSFGGTNPSFGQVTLASFMNGVNVPVSLELASDVSALAPFVTMDMSRGISNWEEFKFINGSGTGEPEGVLDNGNATISEDLSTAGVDAVLDLTGQINPYYYAGASFLMNRLTGIQIAKAQLALNQFQTFWTREGTQDYLLGYPVEYSYQMPAYSASPSTEGAILFGNFKSAVVIGDRHTSAITARVLTEVNALQGIVQFLGFRRSDQRIRLKEAYAQLDITG